ncbi:MAG: hypothetical protein ACYDA5_03790 [Vulcanimicrobiaceae bacterium]
MKKSLRFLALLSLVALAACSSKPNFNYLANGPTPSPSPPPNVTTATVTATYQGNPLPNQQISEYNSANGNLVLPAIAQQNTDSSGQTTFSNLTPGTIYCWRYVYQASPTQTVTPTVCTSAWYNGVKLAG